MNIGPTGIWDCDTEPHSFDEPLAEHIIGFCHLLEIKTAIDLGCGSGAYTDYLNAHGVYTTGYDGNPATDTFSARCHGGIDLTQPHQFITKDLVLSLEVGEHIPKEFEPIFLDNVCNNASAFVILSWFPTPGHGIGHVNEQSNEYIITQMELRGFHFLQGPTAELRDASTLWWFKHSLMAFTRK